MYIKFPELIHLITGSLYLLTVFTHFQPCSWHPPMCFLFLWVVSLDSTYERYHAVFVFLWPVSLGIISSQSIHGVANGRISFLFMSEYNSICCGFPGGSDSEESACNVGDLGSVPGLGRSPGEENDNPTPVFLPGEFHGQNSQTWVSELKKKKKNSICCPVTNRLPDVSLLETGLFGIKKIAICVSNHGEPQASLTGQGKEKAFIKKKRKLDSVNQASMAFHWLSSWLERRGVFTALGSAISTGLESSLSGFPVLFDWRYCLFIFYTLSIYMPHTHIWGHKESDLVFDTHIHTHGVTKSQT